MGRWRGSSLIWHNGNPEGTSQQGLTLLTQYNKLIGNDILFLENKNEDAKDLISSESLRFPSERKVATLLKIYKARNDRLSVLKYLDTRLKE